MQDDLERMRQDWDARAKEDARKYVAAEPAPGGLFGLGGLHDTHTILEDVYRHLADDTVVLEIGCGIGRLLRFFALVFEEVHGIDVSPEMIRQSKDYLRAFPNVQTHCGDGQLLTPFADQSVGFVFSHVVFPHAPSKDIVRTYIHEARRVLAPGGIFKFLVKHKGDQPVDTWHGVNVSMEDIAAWRDETQFELMNSYGVDDNLGCVIFRAPA